MTALPASGERHIVIAKRVAAAVGYEMALNDTAGTLTVRSVIQDGGGATVFISGSNPFLVDTKYLVISTFDRDGNGSVFINNAASGTPASIATRSGDIGNATVFGFGSNSDASNFAGMQMTCGGVWTKVLSAGEMTTLYNNGSAFVGASLSGSLLTGLVDYWDLDEVSGTRVSRSGTNDLTDNNSVGSVAW